MVPRNRLLTLFAWLSVTLASTAHADEAISFSSVTGGFSDGVPRVIGWEFTTGSQPIPVTHLGVYDHGQDGLAASHAVAIYDFQTQVPIATATVPAGNAAALSGVFRYVPVATISLSPNTEYIIAAGWAPSADQLVWAGGAGASPADINDLSVSPAITLGLSITGLPPSARFEDTTSTLEFPDKRIAVANPGDTRTIFVGPNFTFIPEPGSIALAIFGTFCLIAARRAQ